MSDRRAFLKAAIGGAAALAPSVLITRRVSARTVEEPIAVIHLTDNLLLITGAGSNVVVLRSPDGVLMVDGGAPARSSELLKVIGHECGGARVHMVFNTHWHPEHTGVNEKLGRDGARIIAHENTKLWMSTEVWEEWQSRRVPPMAAKGRPNSTFYTRDTLKFGEETIDYGYLGQAHTDGDIYVFFRNANVLVAGDVISVATYPILDFSTGGWIGGMADATQQLVTLADDQTRIIPGIGPVQTRADAVAEQQMLAKVKDELWQMMRKGFGAEDMLAAGASREFDPKWGDPGLFISNAYRGLYGHVRELGGVV